MLQSLFVCRRLLTGGTVIPVSLIAVVPTVLEKSVFYGYLAVASVSLGLLTQFVHCCLAATPFLFFVGARGEPGNEVKKVVLTPIICLRQMERVS